MLDDGNEGQEANDMFVQIIEGRTSDAKALVERGKGWEKELRPGATGFLGSTSGVTADGRAVTIVRFDSEAAAKANSDRPEQGAWWEETVKLYDGDPTFAESSDVSEWLGGGSNTAGFVQIMKSSGVERGQIERLDAAFEPHAENRPEIIGGYRVWTAADQCLEVVYFTSEAAAREGERSEPPAEMKALMEEFQEAMEGTDVPGPGGPLALLMPGWYHPRPQGCSPDGRRCPMGRR